MNDNVKNTNTEATETTIAKEKTSNQENTQAENKKAAEGENGVYVHKFKKQFEYEGKKFDTLNFYFDKLTGRDMLSIEAEMQSQNEYALAPEISRGFQYRMAARAANVGADVIENMPLPDFSKVTNACRDFLISAGY